MSYLFGPAPSRRLGRSLGIDVVPAKICSLDCLYCEVGVTNVCTIERKVYTKAEDILHELSQKFHEYENNIDVITVTGAGEPTLNAELLQILNGIKAITAKIPVAILTNSTLMNNAEVYKTLLKFDIVVPSLDAVSIDVFDKANRPHADIDYDDIINSLIKFSHDFKGKLFLEILLLDGVNDNHQEMLKFADVISKMRVTKVQLGTISRPPAYSQAKVVNDEVLLEFVAYFKSRKIDAEVIGGFKAIHKVTDNVTGLDDKITTLLKMRPCTLDEIAIVFSVPLGHVNESIDRLLAVDKVSVKSYNRKVYYTS